MSILRWILGLALLTPVGWVSIAAQNGSIEVSGRVKIGAKTEKLTRKRFYLLPGGLDTNKALIDKLKAAVVTSRDCFYCQMHASPEFIAWLKAGDGCESPYCREITTDDIAKVPEFQAAYKKGLGQYKNKADVAQKWVTGDLPPNLRDGFYRQRKTLIDSVLAGMKPLQSAMTDTVTVKAIFIDIAVKPDDAKKTTQTFLVSNLLPMEIGGKSYVWACEIEVEKNKTAKLNLQVPDTGKTIKKCEVIVKDLPVCTTGNCAQK